MFRILLSLVATALLASGQLALANEGRQETPEQAHALTDKNKDGAVDREEFRARMVDIFYFSDGDRDGYVVVVEYERTGFEDFDEADSNDDGKLGLYEFVDESFEHFDKADTNNDGRLSLDEVKAEFE